MERTSTLCANVTVVWPVLGDSSRWEQGLSLTPLPAFETLSPLLASTGEGALSLTAT